jgi:hypothetical protein
MSEKKLSPADFREEVQRLHAAGKLPPIHELLSAVADTRKDYADKIIAARNQGEDDASND